jgi:glycine cleavage system H protein
MANLLYSKDHEWVQQLEGNRVRIGISDYAQNSLGDIVFVEIESLNTEIAKDEPFGTVEAVKTVSELYMPIAGSVTEVNPKLEDSPELVNDDPYGDGWMIKLKPDNPADLEKLLSADQYTQKIGE